MATFSKLEQVSRDREKRNRYANTVTPRFDRTMVGTIRTFLNNWKVVFHANGAYYLEDPFGNKQHICSYSKRIEMFSFLKRMDKHLNFADKNEDMGDLLFSFTGKLNIWINRNNINQLNKLS